MSVGEGQGAAWANALEEEKESKIFGYFKIKISTIHWSVLN